MLTTPSGSFVDCANNPIPAGFFGDGSDAFAGRIDLAGQPLQLFSGPSVQTADTIIRRLEDGVLPGCPATTAQDVPIELVALSLASTAPITVTFNGGASPELWDVRVCRSSAATSTGTMTMTQSCAEGGSLSSTLDIVPKLVFTHRGTGERRVLDPGHPVTLAGTGSWVYEPAGVPALTAGAGIQVDGDCDDLPDAVIPVGTSNFFPGIALDSCTSCAAAPGPTPRHQEAVAHKAPDHFHAVNLTPSSACDSPAALGGSAPLEETNPRPARSWTVREEGRAQEPTQPIRTRNFDARPAEANAVEQAPAAAQLAALDTLRTEIPGLAVTFNPGMGTVRSLYNTTGFLTSPQSGEPRDLALAWVQANLGLLGLSGADLGDPETTDSVYSSGSGVTHLYLRQVHQGLPVYNGQLHVNVAADGRILSVNNAFVRGLGSARLDTTPAIGADLAVAGALDHLGLEAGIPELLDKAEGVEQKTSIDPRGISLEPIEARLMWLPRLDGSVRLVWSFQIATLDSLHGYDFTIDAQTGKVWTRFDWAADASFKVYEQPVESPNHTTPLPPADARTLAVNPEDALASPGGWMTTGSSFMTGNNAHACGDASPNNVCDTPEPACAGTGNNAVCDFPLDLSQPPASYLPAAITNLFYWNNLVHDIQYQYGFDEAGGNFQESNFGRGGAGSDSVNADAQDGSGNCNANFSTPTDGGNPRMQMFLCGNLDGDFDNGVIVHEYGHGISIRQVGGPGNSSCLNNTQQPGEGWSDWFALVYTARPGDTGPQPRGLGSYLFGLPPDGGTIRELPYSTDNAVNNWTYESIAGAAVPHGVGSRWAQALWEVYWALVDTYGFDPDLYNAAGGAGNQRALLYVNEGLKNTACSPTFLQTRDGIIQAATSLNGGQDVCLLWEAFAGFGLGTNASTGGSNSLTATNGFNIPASCPTPCSPPAAPAGLTAAVPPGASFRVDLTWNASAGATSYKVLRSTTPCGPFSEIGTTAGTSFSDTGLTAGTTYFYVVQAGNGPTCFSGSSNQVSATPTGSCTLTALYNNTFESGTGLADWIRGSFGGNGSVASWRGIQACTAPSGSHIFRYGGTSCTRNYSNNNFNFAQPNGAGGVFVPAGSIDATLSFQHRRQFENGFDGATLVVSLDGTNYSLVPAAAITGASYNGTVAAGCEPVGSAGLSTFTGTQSFFVGTTVDLDAVCNAITGGGGGCAGQSVRIGFTSITDCSVSADGWFLVTPRPTPSGQIRQSDAG